MKPVPKLVVVEAGRVAALLAEGIAVTTAPAGNATTSMVPLPPAVTPDGVVGLSAWPVAICCADGRYFVWSGEKWRLMAADVLSAPVVVAPPAPRAPRTLAAPQTTRDGSPVGEMVATTALVGFAVGGGEDAAEGDTVLLPKARAAELEQSGRVAVIRDRVKERAAKAERVRQMVASVTAAAQPAPPPSPPAPDPEPLGEDAVTVRTLVSFSLGGGRDVEAGVTMRMPLQDALRRAAAHLVQIVELESVEAAR